MTPSRQALPSVTVVTGQRPAVGLGDIFDLGVFALLVTALVWQSVELRADRPEMSLEVLALGLNGLLAAIGLLSCLRHRYPTLLSCFFFDYIFLAIAPIQQLRFKFDPIYGDEYDLWMTIGLCLLFSSTGLIALIFRGRPTDCRRGSNLSALGADADFYPLALALAIAVVLAVLVALYGPSLLTSREGFFDNVSVYVDKTFSLLLTSFLNPLVFIGSVVGLLASRTAGNRPWFAVFLVLLCFAELVNNPLISARFRASALMAFAIMVFLGWNNTRVLATYLIAGLLASPIFNAFRYQNATAADSRSLEAFFSNIDFDAFSMTSHIIRYTGQNGFSYGDNILSSLLFFVPRSFWSGKSEHLAYYVWPQVRYYRNVWTNNLSSPLFAEGYYAFGLIGAAMITALLFYIFVTLERRAEVSASGSAAQLMACLIPMLAIILLRGPLIVGFSEICGNVAALLTALALMRVRFRLL